MNKDNIRGIIINLDEEIKDLKQASAKCNRIIQENALLIQRKENEIGNCRNTISWANNKIEQIEKDIKEYQNILALSDAE